MWKVERTCSVGFIGEDGFNSFDSAKIEFRHIIKNKHKDSIKHFTDIIDKYCEEFYPNGAPKEILWAKDVIGKIVTEPDFVCGAPELSEDVYFEDDNIQIEYDGVRLIIYPIDIDDIPDDFKFVVAEINATNFYDENLEYYFYISDRKDHEINITLKNTDGAESDEDELDFIDDEDFEDED